MVYPIQHDLMVFGGSLYQTEQWSMSLRMEPSSDGVVPYQESLDNAAAIVSTWWTSGAYSTSKATLEFLKLNRIGTDGKYMNPSMTYLHEYPTPLAGPVAGAGFPAQVSLVATLTTGAVRGLAAKGRIFLPAVAAPVGADGRIQATEATSYAQSVANLLTNLNGAPGLGRVMVISNVREGAARPVTGVQVGRVYDTMRSRRTSLVEEPPAAVPVGGS